MRLTVRLTLGDFCTVSFNYGADAQDTLGGIYLLMLRVVREREPDQDD